MLPVEIILHILSFLSIDELMVLGNVNKRLRCIIRAEKRMNLRSERIILGSFFWIHADVVRYGVWKGYSVEVNGVLPILRFLRFFGRSINDLVFNCEGLSEEQVYIVFMYISRYCIACRSLILTDLTYSLGRSLRRPMRSVEKLSFLSCYLDVRLCDLNRWFPRIENLGFLGGNTFQDRSKLIMRYDYLRKAEIECFSLNEIEISSLRVLNPLALITYHNILSNFV